MASKKDTKSVTINEVKTVINDTSVNENSSLESNNQDLEDPLCTAKSARKITFQDVTTASFLIKGGVEYTPCPVCLILKQ